VVVSSRPRGGLTSPTSVAFSAKDREVDSMDYVTNGMYS
jgi:hypothetical protein